MLRNSGSRLGMVLAGISLACGSADNSPIASTRIGEPHSHPGTHVAVTDAAVPNTAVTDAAVAPGAVTDASSGSWCVVGQALHPVGSSFTCPDDCHVCECEQDGVVVDESSSCPPPEDWLRECVVERGIAHAVGSTWPCEDGCGTCACVPGPRLARRFQTCAGESADDLVCTGPLSLTTQQQLEALEDCTRFEGDLTIAFDADLEALANLKQVDGILSLTASEEGPGPSSLRGLHSLERVTRLWLTGITAVNLEGLESLRVISEPTESMNVESCPNLVDFKGLSGLQELHGMFLDNLPALASLDGIAWPSAPYYGVWLRDLPALNSTTALAEMSDIGVLSLERCTALEELNGGFQNVQLFYAAGNSRLQRLPGFAALTGIGESFELDDNAALEELALPALEQARNVWLRHNDELSQLTLPALTSVTDLRIVDNPRLPTEQAIALGAALGLSNPKIALNQGDDQSPRDPCPWIDDEECDEPDVCAPDTDPWCHAVLL